MDKTGKARDGKRYRFHLIALLGTPAKPKICSLLRKQFSELFIILTIMITISENKSAPKLEMQTDWAV